MVYFSRFDICEAYYLYASHYHSGQSSEVYKIFGRLSKIGFKPSVSLSLPENGREILGFGHGKDTKFLFRGLGRYEAIRAAISVHKAKV